MQLLGLSASYIGVVMFILNAKESDKGGEYVTFLNPYISASKPVSLKKILSYIFPEKTSSCDVIPPFFYNFISSLKGEEVSDSDLSETFHKIKDVSTDDPESFFGKYRDSIPQLTRFIFAKSRYSNAQQLQEPLYGTFG